MPYIHRRYKTLLSFVHETWYFDICNGKIREVIMFLRTFYCYMRHRKSHYAIKIQSISQMMLFSCNPDGGEKGQRGGGSVIGQGKSFWARDQGDTGGKERGYATILRNEGKLAARNKMSCETFSFIERVTYLPHLAINSQYFFVFFLKPLACM